MSVGVGEVYFEVNGDVELQTTGTEEIDALFRCITWRGDPEDTGSDCSITIVTNELQTNTYYVHKSIICFGSKQSKYFASQFIRNVGTKTNDNNQRKNPAVKVELDQRDAENFPLYLDFVYKTSDNPESHSINKQCQSTSVSKIEAPLVANGTMETVQSSFSSPSMISIIPSSSGDIDEVGSALAGTEQITTENAVSLRYLARRFENEALTLVVNKFIQKDLNFSTGPIYLYNAWEYKDERLVESAQRLCVENITQIDMKALVRLPINLFRVVVKSLESFEDENQELSLMLSDAVCRYLEQNPKSSTADLLLDLTDPLMMPYISPDAAIGFTAIVKDLESDDVALHWDSLVRLCRRCAKAVVKEYGWSDFSVSTAVNEYLVTHSNKAKVLNESVEKKSLSSEASVDSLLFATSFAAALEQAQDDYEDVLNAHDQFRRLVKLFEDTASAMEKSQQRKDDYIEKQQNELRRARQEIGNLKRQITELKQQNRQAAFPPQNQKQQLCSNISQTSDKSKDSKSDVFVPLNQSNTESEHKKQKQHIGTFNTNNIPRQIDDSSIIKKNDSQSPPVRPNKQSSPAKKSLRDQRRTNLANNASSPAPMARQRMHHNQLATFQTINSGAHRDPTLKVPVQHLPQHQIVYGEGKNQVIDHVVSRQQPRYKQHHRTQGPRPFDEPIVHLCMGAQREQHISPPPPQQQQQFQHQQSQLHPKRTHRHLPLNRAKDEQYKYHPDLLEMSYSEPVTTMDEEDDEDEGYIENDNDDDYDSLFEIEMSFSSLGQDLISPSQVGVDVHNNKNEKRRELKTRNEMRSKSLLV
jgi:BTB/POZ domain